MIKNATIGTIIVYTKNNSGLGVVKGRITFNKNITTLYCVWMFKDKIELYLLLDDFKVYA